MKGKKKVLADHRRQGRRLVPPIMALPNLVETSFRDQMLPELIWISALFNSASDKIAATCPIEFQRACQKAVGREVVPTLSYLSNFNRLNDEQKSLIRSSSECAELIEILQDHLWHQNALLDRFPLGFIFEGREIEDPDEAIERLKQDVAVLLDRYSYGSTKIQTTAVIGMMATGKIHIARSIDLPDPNCIFINPDSEDSKRVASFVRAFLNAGKGMDVDGEYSRDWCDDFWLQAYRLEGCT